MSDDDRVRMQLRIAPNLAKAARMIAAVDQLSLDHVLCRALREYIERRPEIVAAVEAVTA